MEDKMMGRVGKTFLSGALVLSLAPSAAWAGVSTAGAAGAGESETCVAGPTDSADGALSDAELVAAAQAAGRAMFAAADDGDEVSLAANASGTTDDGWQWTSDGTSAQLVAYKGTSTTPTVPAQVNSVPVTGVIVNSGAGAVKITSIGLSAVKSTLGKLKVYGCSLSSLSLSGCTALTYIDVRSNVLESLTVSDCAALDQLYCSGNKLSALNVTACTALTRLYCDNNKIASLDVSRCSQLYYLKCNDNKLTALSVGANVYLNDLYCYNNYISDDLTTLTSRYGKDANVILPQYSGSPTPDPTLVDVSTATISAIADQTFYGSAVRPAVTVKVGDKTLTEGTDYAVTYANNDKVGKATATITGIGSYTGARTVQFNVVEPTSGSTVAKVAVPVAAAGLTYTGSEQVGVAAGEGYTLSGTAKATAAGDYTATATLKDGYAWSDGSTAAKAVKWSIAQAGISSGEVKVSGSTVYMGRAVEPSVAVTVGGKTLAAGTDYAVAYSGNEGFGTGRATVTGKGNYSGTLTADFEITSDVVNVFSDANRGDWYVESGALDYAYAHGLISGYSGTDLVGAYDPIKRQDVAVILWRMAGEPEVAAGDSFEDVDYGDYYGPAVRWARATGVINGYQDADGAYRTFGPSDLVTREQLAAMIANYAEKVGGMTVSSNCAKLDALPDAGSVSGWARTSVGWCMDKDIMNGVNVEGAAYAQPAGNAWRASMASMAAVLHRDVLKLG